MILRSIECENFGRYQQQAFELRRGMNLIVGPNEAGKSTMVEAIPAVLFGSREVELYKPWGGKECSARLVFEGKGRTVEISRNLLTDEVHLVERDDLYHVLAEFQDRVSARGRGAVFQEYRALLQRLLGIGDEELFRATCFFGHQPREWTGEELAAKLRALVGSGAGQQDYGALMDRLLEEYFQLTRVNPWGRNKQQDRELELIDSELARLQDDDQQQPEITSQADHSRQASIDALEEEISRDRAEFERGAKYVEQVRNRSLAEPSADINETHSEPEPPPSENAIDDDFERRLADCGLPVNLSPQTPVILNEAAGIRRELAQLQRSLAAVQQTEKAIIKPSWRLLGGLTLFLAIVAGGAWLFDFHFGWVGAAASCLLLVVAVFGARQQIQANRQLGDCDKEQKKIEKAKAEVLSRQEQVSHRCEALGLPTSPVDLVRLEKLVEGNRQLLDEYWQRGENEDTTKATPVVSPDAKVPAEAKTDEITTLSAANELADLEQRLAEFEESLLQREAELEQLKNEVDSDSPSATVSNPDLKLLRQNRAKIEQRIVLLREAIEILAEAVDRYAKSDLMQLTSEVSRLFGRLTGGRYQEVRLDSNMHPELKVDSRRWQPAERFSRGTVDALYLSLRVALARVRGDGQSLPLVFDDPFVHLDQHRYNKALNVLEMAAAQGQIILLSHNQELAKRAARERWHVIALGGFQPAGVGTEESEHDGQLHLL
ncbi:MAG: hypothetical protein C0614_01710 [Desulfuromonas sp.]|nr:MAG: hypothetical protein C0614_01710 [Desulfuromonas sp.]